MIELLVRLEDELYEQCKNTKLTKENEGFDFHIIKSVANGTPLPKGHGRILDEKDILDTKNNDGGWYDLVDMPEYIAGVKAIIEADKESEDKE